MFSYWRTCYTILIFKYVWRRSSLRRAIDDCKRPFWHRASTRHRATSRRSMGCKCSLMYILYLYLHIDGHVRLYPYVHLVYKLGAQGGYIEPLQENCRNKSTRKKSQNKNELRCVCLNARSIIKQKWPRLHGSGYRTRYNRHHRIMGT